MRSKLAFIPFDDSPSSYYITITVPSPPKIKIKIPKLLAKTMQKRFQGYDKTSTIERGGDYNDDDDDHHCRNKPKRTKLGKLLTLRRVRSMFANVFGNDEASSGEERGNHEKGGFFGKNVAKRIGFGFRRERNGVRESIGDGNEMGGSCNKGARVETSTASKRVVVIRKRESARKLANASKRVVQNRRACGVVGSLRKIGSKRFDLKCLDLKHVNVAEEKESLELCKKRILMGSKCKPLTISGALHYDKNGILLPEEIP